MSGSPPSLFAAQWIIVVAKTLIFFGPDFILLPNKKGEKTPKTRVSLTSQRGSYMHESH